MSSDIDDPPMSLVAHLTELRDRLLRCVLAVLVAFIVPFMYANEIYLFVSEPLRALLPPGTSMIATEVAAPFLVPFKLSVVTAIFIVVPYILFQLWGFIAPGLYRHEKRFAIPILVSSVLLFYAGVAFAYYLVFPLVFNFFASVIPTSIAYTPDINHYLDIVLKLFFAFGLAFEIPIATVLMIRTGITSPAALSAKRPYIIVGCFVVAMLLTPPDVFSQILLAVPMWLLFESGLWLGRWFERDKENKEDTEHA
ncbi:MAG: twin-arginine translocase subunit TatC [Spongiibacteraceae bacterium]|jgi:sec-independent protein translocase protein TatC|nr:twin-arginine translocase subunit TatC [Spongiibacteraceae bacterium]